jgi:hypothetical protein
VAKESRRALAFGGEHPAQTFRALSFVRLFDHLCERNAIQHNPVQGVKRPNEGANEAKTPAISDKRVHNWKPRAGTHSKASATARSWRCCSFTRYVVRK